MSSQQKHYLSRNVTQIGLFSSYFLPFLKLFLKKVNVSLYRCQSSVTKQWNDFLELKAKDVIKGRVQKQNFIPALTALYIRAECSKNPESN